MDQSDHLLSESLKSMEYYTNEYKVEEFQIYFLILASVVPSCNKLAKLQASKNLHKTILTVHVFMHTQTHGP